MPKRSEKRDTAKAEYIAKKKKGEEVNQSVGADDLQVHCQGPVFEPDARGAATARKEET